MKAGTMCSERTIWRSRCACAAQGSDHRKFLRQVFVSADITAPLYWWKEFDTYKVSTVANSTSTMHKLHSSPITAADFSCEKMRPETRRAFDAVIERLEALRQVFVETKDRAVWYDMIQFLPSSYNQMRTCTFNYENLINMYAARLPQARRVAGVLRRGRDAALCARADPAGGPGPAGA